MRQLLESTARFLKEIGAEMLISADNILRIIERMTLDAIESMINSMLMDMIRASWWRNKKTTMAFDLTDELYYGKSGGYVLNTKPRKGTHKAFKFLQCFILSKQGKFAIYAHIMREDETLHDALKNAIRYVRRIVNISTIILDKGFFSVKILKMLKGMRIPYIIAISATKRIKGAFERLRKKVFRVTFVSKKYGRFHALIVARTDDKKPVFYAIFNDRMLRKPSDIHYAYKKRWCIKINNKMIKLYKARTSSTDPRVRLFLFGFSCLVYDIWLLSGFNMIRSGKDKMAILDHYKYYSAWSMMAVFHAIISLL